MKYDINKPKMRDSIAVDVALSGYLNNNLNKKYTYGWLYRRLTEGYVVEMNPDYVNVIAKGLEDRMNQHGYPEINIVYHYNIIRKG